MVGIILWHSLRSSLICPLLPWSCLVSCFRPSSLVRSNELQEVTDRKWTTSFKKVFFLESEVSSCGLTEADYTCYLCQRKGPCAVFELVLYRSQLCELREVWKRLQPADDLLKLLLIFYDEELQQTEHLQERQSNRSNQCRFFFPSASPVCM